MGAQSFLHSCLLVASLTITASAKDNFTTVLASNPNLTNLTEYLAYYPQIVQSLASATNVTFLAPNNDAFTKLLSGPAASQLQAGNTTLIEGLFDYHLLNGLYTTNDFSTEPSFVLTFLTDPPHTDLAEGQVVEAFTTNTGTTFISGLLGSSNAVETNIGFDGGIIHVVDTFLTIPQNLTVTLDALNLTAFLGLIAATSAEASEQGLDADIVSSLTTFVPTNAAFEAIGSIFSNLTALQLYQIYGYHLLFIVLYSPGFSDTPQLPAARSGNLQFSVEGQKLYVDSALVVLPNVLHADGVVHIIDKVLNPNGTGIPDPSATSPVPDFAASPLAGGELPFTSGIPTPSSAISTPALLLGQESTLDSASVSLAASRTAPTTTSTQSPGTHPQSSSGLSTGAKAGIGIGCALGAILLLLVAFYLLRSRKRTKRDTHPKEAETSPPEKDLPAELATKRDHAAELPAKEARSAHSVAQASSPEPANVIVDGRQELDGVTVGPELAERGSTVKKKARPKPEPEGYASFG